MSEQGKGGIVPLSKQQKEQVRIAEEQLRTIKGLLSELKRAGGNTEPIKTKIRALQDMVNRLKGGEE